MTKAKRQARAQAAGGVVETVNSVHVVNAISQSITPDRKFAMIVFEVVDKVDKDGKPESTKKFGISMDAVSVAWFRSVAVGLEGLAYRDGVFGLQQHGGWGVGSSQEQPMSVIVVSPVAVTCSVVQYQVGLPDVDMIKLARVIMRDVLPRLTPAELAESLKLPPQTAPVPRKTG